MKCSQCGFENIDKAKFCNECGRELELLCPQCENANPPGSKFCNECGQDLTQPSKPVPRDLSPDEKVAKIQRYLPQGLAEKILAQRDKIEGERKNVTVMFCDLEGFTAVSEKLGPEDTYALMNPVYEIQIHGTQEYGGTVNEMTGDGIMALFGAPVALEDAPQRAIRAALVIHREMVRFNDKLKKDRRGLPTLRMRIGIHTGPVVVGTLGNDLRVEFKAVGDTVNLASRMEGLAEPGTTYVTEATFKQTASLFRFEALGEKAVKGKHEPVKVYRVIAPSTVRARFDASAERSLTPFVGRERELELLLDGFARAKSGRGQAFSIVAEAGYGKSRILYEFRIAVIHEEVTFLEGHCLSYSRNVAYNPIIDILKANFDVLDSDRDLDIRDKVSRGLTTLSVEETSTLRYLLELLSVKDSAIDQISAGPEVQKKRILEALKRIVLRGAEIRPLILAVENLHWVDQSSEECLKLLLENISGAPVLLIFTYRPEYVHAWGNRSYHSQVNLNRLSNRESLSMATHLLGTDELDAALEELILEKTEGVPFFVEEFVKSLQDLHAIESRDGTCRIAERGKALAIPAEIQDVIMSRIDALPEGAKSLIQTGSVAGREFSHDLMQRVTGLPEPELLSRLSVLKDAELLYERGIYPQATYVFKHALIQDVANQSLLTNARQKHHRRIARVLEEHFPETADAQPELLGHHYTEAGAADEAVHYWQRAGEKAVRSSAYAEAVAHFTAGLDLSKTLPEDSDRIQTELALRLALGPTLLVARGYASPEVGENYERARELCQQDEDPKKLFQTLSGLRPYHSVRAEYQTSYEVGEKLLALAQKQQDEAYYVVARRSLGDTLFWLGDFEAARSHLEDAIATYNPSFPPSMAFVFGAHIMTHCLCYLAFILDWQGYPDQALAKSHEAVELGMELSHPFSLATATFFTALHYYSRRDIHATQEHAQAAVDMSIEHGFPFWRTGAAALLGWVLVQRGELEAGVEKIREGLRTYGATGAKQWQPCGLSLLAEACWKAGQIEDGLSAISEALSLVEKTGERCWETEIYRLNGHLLRAQSPGNQVKVEKCFRHAIDLAQAKNAKSLELKATTSLSRLWRDQGKREAARDALAKIYGWFTDGFDTPYVKEARELLEELGG
jgi:class 3 adenylate cyclase/predicted ATPase